MTSTEDTNVGAPVAPPKPRVEGLGRRSRAAAIQAAAARRGGSPPPTAPASLATPAEPPAAEPVVPIDAAPIPQAPTPPQTLNSNVASSPPVHDPEPPKQLEGARSASVEARPVGYDPDDAFWTVGKTQRTTYVPPTLAAKVKEMQQTGTSAEVIVLNAVAAAAQRLPDLIRAARGPVHEGGMFPGLQVLEPRPAGRPKTVEDNTARLQFGLRPAYRETLMRLARTHNLAGSVLVRLALGDYFNVPVRLGRR